MKLTEYEKEKGYTLEDTQFWCISCDEYRNADFGKAVRELEEARAEIRRLKEEVKEMAHYG